MFGEGLYVYQPGFFPRKNPGWLLNIVQTWHKPCKLDPNFVQILSKPKVAGLSDTNRPNLTKFGQTRCEPGANLSRPLHWQVQRPGQLRAASESTSMLFWRRLPPNKARLLVLRSLVLTDDLYRPGDSVTCIRVYMVRMWRPGPLCNSKFHSKTDRQQIKL